MLKVSSSPSFLVYGAKYLWYRITNFFFPDKMRHAHNLANDVQIQNFVFQLTHLEAPFKPACGTKNLLTSKTYSASRCRAECNFKYLMELCKCRFLTLPHGGQKDIYLI